MNKPALLSLLEMTEIKPEVVRLLETTRYVASIRQCDLRGSVLWPGSWCRGIDHHRGRESSKRDELSLCPASWPRCPGGAGRVRDKDALSRYYISRYHSRFSLCSFEDEDVV